MFFSIFFGAIQAQDVALSRHYFVIAFSKPVNQILNSEEVSVYNTSISNNYIFCFKDEKVISDVKQYAQHVGNVLWVNPYFEYHQKPIAVAPNEFFVRFEDASSAVSGKKMLSRLAVSHVQQDEFDNQLFRFQSDIPINDLESFCKETKNQLQALYVSPNYIFHPLVSTNDLYYPRQWSIENTGSAVQYSGTPDADMDVKEAWDITTGDPSIKVVILDSGVDTAHTDLRNNLLPGYDAVGDSTAGYPTPNYDSDGHGTCCAGIVAAQGNNSVGIAGVAYDCKVVPVRAFYYIDLGGNKTPYSTAAIFARAYDWSREHADADIISSSWGLPSSLIGLLSGGTPPVDSALERCNRLGRAGKGIPLFFSSGNDYQDPVIWPSSLSYTISVGATSMCDEQKNPSDCSGENWGSNFGAGLNFAAPGVKIASTDMRGIYGFSSNDYTFTFNGTSAACPNAAGVAALMLSYKPDLKVEDVIYVMQMTCEKVGGYAYDSISFSGSWCREIGFGRLNAFNALNFLTDYHVGIQFERDDYVSVYPNPTSESVYLHDSQNRIDHWEICNLQGQKIAVLPKGSQYYTFTQAGLYLVQAKDEAQNYVVTKKVLVVKN